MVRLILCLKVPDVPAKLRFIAFANPK